MDITPAKVEGVVEAAGCLPPAISHASAYMNQMRSMMVEVLTFYLGENGINVNTTILSCDLVIDAHMQ
jgi:ABC-type transport system substrate-binding protein